jgi:hypothetical protein
MNLLKGHSDKDVRAVMIRFYKSQCIYCRRFSPGVMEIDHLHPKSKGGTNALENYLLACAECNRLKGDMVIEEPGVSWYRALARSNAPKILKMLEEHRQSHFRYNIKLRQISKTCFELSHGLRIVLPKPGNVKGGWVLYQMLARYPHREERIYREHMYFDIILDREGFLGFLNEHNLNQKQFREWGDWLSKIRIVDGRRKRSLLSEFVVQNRNFIALKPENTLTKIHGVKVSLMVSDKLLKSHHRLVQA